MIIVLSVIAVELFIIVGQLARLIVVTRKPVPHANGGIV